MRFLLSGLDPGIPKRCCGQCRSFLKFVGQRVDSSQLAEEHGNKLRPGGEAPGMTFAFRFLHTLMKIGFWKRVVKFG